MAILEEFDFQAEQQISRLNNRLKLEKCAGNNLSDIRRQAKAIDSIHNCFML